MLACFAHRDVTHSKCLALPQKTQCIMYAQVLPDTSFLISERNSNTRSQMGYFPRNSRMEKHQPALQYYRKFGNIFKKKKKSLTMGRLVDCLPNHLKKVLKMSIN